MIKAEFGIIDDIQQEKEEFDEELSSLESKLAYYMDIFKISDVIIQNLHSQNRHKWLYFCSLGMLSQICRF